MSTLMRFKHNRFLLLFLSLMLYFIIPPFFIDTPHRMHIISTLFSLILLISVYAIEMNKRILHIGVALAVLLLAVRWASALHELGARVILFETAITCAFFALTSVAVINYIIRSEEVTATTIFGAICGYLLMGLAWSFLHALIYSVDYQAYVFPANPSHTAQIETLNFIYFSFISLTTVGYGDITPVSHVARTFSWLEAVAGQIYLTVWIARLLALHITREKPRKIQ